MSGMVERNISDFQATSEMQAHAPHLLPGYIIDTRFLCKVSNNALSGQCQMLSVIPLLFEVNQNEEINQHRTMHYRGANA